MWRFAPSSGKEGFIIGIGFLWRFVPLSGKQGLIIGIMCGDSLHCQVKRVLLLLCVEIAPLSGKQGFIIGIVMLLLLIAFI